MSIPDYSDWTPEQRRAYIQNQIPLATWFNRSGVSILEELRERGLGIGTNTFYDIRRERIAPSDIEQALEYLGDNDTIPVSLAEQRPDWNLSNNYLFQFKVVGRDPRDGSKKVGFFAISSGSTLGKQEANDIIGGMIEGEEEFYGIVPEDISLYALYSQG